MVVDLHNSIIPVIESKDAWQGVKYYGNEMLVVEDGSQVQFIVIKGSRFECGLDLCQDGTWWSSLNTETRKGGYKFDEICYMIAKELGYDDLWITEEEDLSSLEPEWDDSCMYE